MNAPVDITQHSLRRDVDFDRNGRVEELPSQHDLRKTPKNIEDKVHALWAVRRTKQIHIEELFELSGYIIWVFLALTMLLCGGMLSLGGEIGSFLLLPSLLFSAWVVGQVTRTFNVAYFSRLTIILVVVFGISFVAASYFHDISFDGNAYHKQGVYALAHGWNPILESSSSQYLVPETSVVWIDHYAQGLYFIQACIYTLTGYLEISKSTTFLAVYAFAAIAFSFLKCQGIERSRALAVSILIAANPIVLAQVSSFYVDGFMCVSLFTLIVCLTALVVGGGDRLVLLLVFSSIVLCVGTKFTGLAYAGLFCMAYGVAYIAVNRRAPISAVPFAVVLLGFIVGFGVVGASSYVGNLLYNGNPLYPLFGSDKLDIMNNNEPRLFHGMSIPEKLFYAYFSKCENIHDISGVDPSPKIPLFIQSSELLALRNYDLRISGFGPLYSAILLLQIPLSIWMMAWFYRYQKQLFCAVLAYLVPAVVLQFCLNDSWWARYSPYVYFVNMFILLYCCQALPKSRKEHKGKDGIPIRRERLFMKRLLSITLIGLLGFNMAIWVLYSIGPHIQESLQVEKVIRSFETLDQDEEIIVSYEVCSGLLYTLKDRNISFSIAAASDNDYDGEIGRVKYKIAVSG